MGTGQNARPITRFNDGHQSCLTKIVNLTTPGCLLLVDQMARLPAWLAVFGSGAFAFDRLFANVAIVTDVFEANTDSF